MLLASGSGRGGSGARTLMRAAPGCSSAAARWSRRHSDVREQNEAQGIRHPDWNGRRARRRPYSAEETDRSSTSTQAQHSGAGRRRPFDGRCCLAGLPYLTEMLTVTLLQIPWCSELWSPRRARFMVVYLSTSLVPYLALLHACDPWPTLLCTRNQHNTIALHGRSPLPIRQYTP
jgi:hypothetical protein